MGEGVISDEERDRIEQEMVAFIKACSTSVEQLSRTVAAVQEKKSRREADITEQAIAHRHGMVRLRGQFLLLCMAVFCLDPWTA